MTQRPAEHPAATPPTAGSGTDGTSPPLVISSSTPRTRVSFDGRVRAAAAAAGCDGIGLRAEHY